MVIMAEIEVERCGVKFDPPAIVLLYNEKDTKKHKRRTMPLRNFTKTSNVEKAAEELRSCPRHSKYVANIKNAQLLRLITIIRDKLNGMSLTASLAKNDELDKIDPEENLNVVDEEVLKRKKSVMDATFEKNRVKPNDPNFKYDVEVDFEVENPIESGWDSGSDPDF